jgi:hypothetical protein
MPSEDESRFIEKISSSIDRGLKNILGETGCIVVKQKIIEQIKRDFHLERSRGATISEIIYEARTNF